MITMKRKRQRIRKRKFKLGGVEFALTVRNFFWWEVQDEFVDRQACLSVEREEYEKEKRYCMDYEFSVGYVSLQITWSREATPQDSPYLANLDLL
jgi:hypothetical protein